MPGPASVRKWAASNELQTPEPEAKSSKEGESHNDDIIRIHAGQDLEYDNAADKISWMKLSVHCLPSLHIYNCQRQVLFALQ